MATATIKAKKAQKPVESVSSMLKALASCRDKQKAAYLRLKLRKAGHKGGLRPTK